MIFTLRRILRVLVSPSRLKRAIGIRLQLRLRRLVAWLLPEAVSQPVAHIEIELAELRYSILKLESREHLLRVGSMDPAPRLPEQELTQEQQ